MPCSKNTYLVNGMWLVFEVLDNKYGSPIHAYDIMIKANILYLNIIMGIMDHVQDPKPLERL